jgi:hypothetical protein
MTAASMAAAQSAASWMRLQSLRRHFDGDWTSVRVDDSVDFRGTGAQTANRPRLPLFRPPPSDEPWPSSCRWLDIRRIGGRQRVKQPTPNPAHRPAAKAM